VRHLPIIVSLCFAGLAGCGREPAVGTPVGKVSGPPIQSLNHDQLMAIFHECHQFGQVDDARVKYTIPYCVSVDTAQSAEGWTTPKSAKVDPTLNKLH
jgi:hypothetical protein